MEFLSSKILCSQTKPNEKSLLVGIPMYMYRVQSYGFTSELNFIQHIVLKFKRQPGTSMLDINRMTGLDVRLLQRVENELIRKHLLTEFGGITPLGIEQLDNKNAVIIDDANQQIGYVFQYATQSNYYPYYIPRINEVESLDDEDKLIAIDIENESAVENLFKLNLNNSLIQGNMPSDVEVCHLIENTKRHTEDVEDSEELESLSKLLSIRFVPNASPIPVIVCAYIYLPLVNEDEGIYSSEWKVTNPFGEGDSEELEIYLKHLKNSSLKRKIENEFRDAETDMNRKFADVNNMLEDAVSEEIKTHFSLDFQKLTDDMQDYVKSTIRCYVCSQHNSHFNYINPLYIEMQKSVENILAEDYHKRASVYNRMEQYFYKDSADVKCKRSLNRWNRQLYNQAHKLFRAAKGAKERTSMLSSFASMILTYDYDSTARIFDVFRNHIQFIINLRFLRNDSGHAGRNDVNVLSADDKDTSKLYQSYIQIVKSYINIQ